MVNQLRSAIEMLHMNRCSRTKRPMEQKLYASGFKITNRAKLRKINSTMLQQCNKGLSAYAYPLSYVYLLTYFLIDLYEVCTLNDQEPTFGHIGCSIMTLSNQIASPCCICLLSPSLCKVCNSEYFFLITNADSISCSDTDGD